MYLCSSSQNSVPLHLARHAVASTDGVFFEGKSHSRTKGTPPAVLCCSRWAQGMLLPWKSLGVGGAFGCNREQTHTAPHQRAGSKDGWMDVLGMKLGFADLCSGSATRELNQQDGEMLACVCLINNSSSSRCLHTISTQRREEKPFGGLCPPCGDCVIVF